MTPGRDMMVSPPKTPAPVADSAKQGAWLSLWRTLLRIETGKITPVLAFRNTLGFVLPLAIFLDLGKTSAAFAIAMGALNVSFSDSDDPYVSRLRKMLAASIMAGIAVCLGSACGHSHIWTVLLIGVWAFAAGMMVALGTTATDVANMSLVILVVYSTVPKTTLYALYSGLLAASGGLLQTLLSIAFWPIRRYEPERRQLGTLYLELSRRAGDRIDIKQGPPASDVITQTHTKLAGLAHDHSDEADRYRSILNQAERIRLSVMLLGRLRIRLLREGSGGTASDIVAAYLGAVENLLLDIGNSLMSGLQLQIRPERLRELALYADRMRSLQPDSAAAEALVRDARIHMDALTGQVRAAADLASRTTPDGLEQFQRTEAQRPWRLRLDGPFTRLAANLSLQSTTFRHAIRLAVCVAAADAIARSIDVQRSYWLPMTTAIILRPDFQTTFSRGLLRLLGTFFGLIVATGLFHLLHPSVGLEVVLLAVLMFTMRCVGPANYGILAASVTALVVVLLALNGFSPKDVIMARGVNTLGGGLIALTAYWLWPTWERMLAPETMARMLDAYREYFHAIRRAYLNPDAVGPDELDKPRVCARRERSNVEASIERLQSEPGTKEDTIVALNAMLASSHRLIHAMMALEAELANSRSAPRRPAIHTFANDVELTLSYLARALRGSSFSRDLLPDLREDHYRLVHTPGSAGELYTLVNVETDRITNSLNTLSEQVLTWSSTPRTQVQAN